MQLAQWTLTFDDGPLPADLYEIDAARPAEALQPLQDILDVLATYREGSAPAVFFLRGPAYPWSTLPRKSLFEDGMKRIRSADSRHELALHCYKHDPDLWFSWWLRTSAEITQDLEQGLAYFQSIDPTPMSRFRPPYGKGGFAGLMWASQHNFVYHSWDLDSEDWMHHRDAIKLGIGGYENDSQSEEHFQHIVDVLTLWIPLVVSADKSKEILLHVSRRTAKLLRRILDAICDITRRVGFEPRFVGPSRSITRAPAATLTALGQSRMRSAALAGGQSPVAAFSASSAHPVTPRGRQSEDFFFQTFRDDRLSLWQSAAQDVALKRGVLQPMAATAGSGPHPVSDDFMVAATRACAQAVARESAPRVTTFAAAPSQVLDCAGIYLALAIAHVSEDPVKVHTLEQRLRFGSCDIRYKECLEQFLEYFALRRQGIPYRVPKSSGDFVYDGMADDASVALFADAGTGLDARDSLFSAIGALKPEFAIHLGDIYYAGTANEVQANFAAPRQRFLNGSRVFTLSGNHDMYSGGQAYYDLLTALGQGASYFCLRGKFWQFLAMDTGLHDNNPFDAGESTPFLEATEIEWLRDKIQSFGGRTILLSHHQPFSAFDKLQGDHRNSYLLEPFSDLLGKVAVWFWGHEHRLTAYRPYATPNGTLIHGRCIGAGGVPVRADEDAYRPTTDDPKFSFDPTRVPEVVDSLYNNAFVVVSLKGPSATISYYQGLHTFSQLGQTEQIRIDPSTGALNIA